MFVDLTLTAKLTLAKMLPRACLHVHVHPHALHGLLKLFRERFIEPDPQTFRTMR